MFSLFFTAASVLCKHQHASRPHRVDRICQTAVEVTGKQFGSVLLFFGLFFLLSLSFAMLEPFGRELVAPSQYPHLRPKVFHEVADTLGGASAQGLRVEPARHGTPGEQHRRIGTPFGLAPLWVNAQLRDTTVEGQMSGQGR